MIDKGMVATVFGGFIFGVFGFAGFAYGKKQANWKLMALGILLMAFPYFVSNAILLFTIGIALTVALFIFRD